MTTQPAEATTKAIEDGGPAFPLSYLAAMNGSVVDFGATGGMTIRDWFAGQALAGFASSFRKTNREHDRMVHRDEPAFDYTQPEVEEGLEPGMAEHVARSCYELADSLIAARKGGVA